MNAAAKGRRLQNKTVAYLRDHFDIRVFFPAKGLHRGKKGEEGVHGESAIHQVDLIGFSDGNDWLIESTTDGHTSRAKAYCRDTAKAFEKLKREKMPKFAIVTWKDGRKEPRVLAAYMPEPGEDIEWKDINSVK